MSIGEFASNITTDNFTGMIKDHYDEVVVLYNIFAHVPEVKNISANIDERAEFIIATKNNKDAKIIFDKHDGEHLSLCEDIYRLAMELQDKSVITIINK